MKIVVDDKIPYILPTLRMLAEEVVALPGADICATDVRDADVLVVRTRTRCDASLLSGSSVKLVATATIGYDHLDVEYLQRSGIRWVSCPGCNASSVAQYVECSLLLLSKHYELDLSQHVLGVVGCGHVGSLVCNVGEHLGMKVLVNDPPLSRDGFVSLDELTRRADIITFHVPLTRHVPYPTWHLADDVFFSRLERQPFIVNTSRGAVVDNAALLHALETSRARDAIIDVWEGEPNVNTDLLQRVFIGTPHIAGYSADGKANADNMVVSAICQQFGLPKPDRILPPQLPASFCYTGNPLELYNPMRDSDMLKRQPALFEHFRGSYPLRRECYDVEKC